MSADALAPEVARASADMLLAEWDKQHIIFVPQFIPSTWVKPNNNEIQDMIQNVIIFYKIFKTTWHIRR